MAQRIRWVCKTGICAAEATAPALRALLLPRQRQPLMPCQEVYTPSPLPLSRACKCTQAHCAPFHDLRHRASRPGSAARLSCTSSALESSSVPPFTVPSGRAGPRACSACSCLPPPLSLCRTLPFYGTGEGAGARACSTGCGLGAGHQAP